MATGLRLFFVTVSVTLGVAIALCTDATELALRNMVSPAVRNRLIVLPLLAGLVSSCAGAVYVLCVKRAALARLDLLTRLVSPLLLSAFVPSLFDWEVFRGRDFLFAALATLFGLALERTLRTALGAAVELRLIPARQVRPALATRTTGPRTRWLFRHGPALVLAALVLSFAAYMITYSVRQHYQLRTYSWDLGIFNNLMYNLLRGHWFKASPVLGPTGSHLQFHATFGAYLLAPFYALWQKPEMLLALQAALVAAGAIPLYLLAKLRLGSAWLGLYFAYAYLVHAPLHGPLFYDFHFLTISPVFVLTVLYCFESGRQRALILAWLAAISMREEVSATLALAALYYVLTGKRPRWALWGGLFSGIYFLLVKFYVMPAHGLAGHSFAWIFQGLIAPGDTGFSGVLRTLATNPVFTLSTVVSAEKFEYLLRTLGPMLLLPLRQRFVWVLCLPAFVFTLLSTGYAPMLQTRFQYTANWTPYVMVGSLFVLDSWRRSSGGWLRASAALPALCLSTTLFSYNFGAIFQRNNFFGGFHQVSFDFTASQRDNYDRLQRLIQKIPDSAQVSACELLVPHVSSREDAFTLNRVGAAGADYLLCSTDWLRIQPVSGFMRQALGAGEYSFVERSGSFALWKKGGDPGRNAEGMKLLGPPFVGASGSGTSPGAVGDNAPSPTGSPHGSGAPSSMPSSKPSPPTRGVH